MPEKIAGSSSPSSVDVSEIMKIMIEYILFVMLSPLGSDLTSLLQSKETALTTGECQAAKETVNDERDASHPKYPATSLGGKNCSTC